MNIALDPRTRVLDEGRTLVGGDPWRVLRLTEGGAAVARGLLDGRDGDSAAGGALARRLVEAGLAHPRPADLAGSCAQVTVVIPVRDRAPELERCLVALRADAPGRVVVVDDGSGDPDATAAVVARAGAGCELIRRGRPGGPAVARNQALERIEAGMVALLDSDCVPRAGWLARLCGVLEADPGLGAVAPRVRPLTTSGVLARFAAVRSPLDLGPYPSLVRPGGRVAYVPTAALVARRDALAGFDPALRYGEDVDLVWRMLDAGWSVRYEPAAVVGHGEPQRLRPWLTRRLRYGTAAGPLARRHPERLAPVVIHPRSAATLGAATIALSWRRAPRAAALTPVALHMALVVRSLSRHGVPRRAAAALALQGLGDSGAALGRSATMLGSGVVGGALASRRTRPAALAVLLASPTRDYLRLRPPLDPLRFAALAIADDVAYGAGVWTGALQARTLRPLRPRIVGLTTGRVSPEA